jgi:excisionase family DNA binding protein
MNLEKVDDFLTVKELSKWIKLSESHIYFLVNKRKIPFAKLGGKLLFDKQKIKEWIDFNSPQPSDEPVESVQVEPVQQVQELSENLIPTDIDIPQENVNEAEQISTQEPKFENQVDGD